MLVSLGHSHALGAQCSPPPPAGWLLVEEGILLGLAANGHPPVIPCCDVVIDQCRGVVVVARIFRYDAWVRLAGKGAHYVAERHVGEPSNTVVGGLAPPHLVARNGRVALLAVGTPARVIPHRKDSATRADRDVRLPLRAGSAIGVQFAMAR